MKSLTGWWCNVPILKNDGVRQWGWDDIPYMKWTMLMKSWMKSLMKGLVDRIMDQYYWTIGSKSLKHPEKTSLLENPGGMYNIYIHLVMKLGPWYWTRLETREIPGIPRPPLQSESPVLDWAPGWFHRVHPVPKCHPAWAASSRRISALPSPWQHAEQHAERHLGMSENVGLIFPMK